MERAGVVTDISRNSNVQRIAWTGLANGDTGSKVKMSEYADRSVQVAGVPGVGGTIVIEGSNDDGATWATLTDPQGNALSFIAAKIEAVTEVVQFIRPSVTAGDGNTAFNVYLLCRKAR